MKQYRLTMLQFVPRGSSDERLNIGVAVFAPETGEFLCRITSRSRRLSSAFPTIHGEGVRRILLALVDRARSIETVRRPRAELMRRYETLEDALNSLVLPHSESFRWTPPRSGVCDDLEVRLSQVYDEYVGRFELSSERDRIDDDGLWALASRVSPMAELLPKLRPLVLASDLYRYEFRAAWRNGTTQVLEPISLDYTRAHDIVERANTWAGRLVALSHSGMPFHMTALITDAPAAPERREKYEAAVKILRASDRVRTVVPIRDAEKVAAMVLADGHS